MSFLLSLAARGAGVPVPERVAEPGFAAPAGAVVPRRSPGPFGEAPAAREGGKKGEERWGFAAGEDGGEIVGEGIHRDDTGERRRRTAADATGTAGSAAGAGRREGGSGAGAAGRAGASTGGTGGRSVSGGPPRPMPRRGGDAAAVGFSRDGTEARERGRREQGGQGTDRQDPGGRATIGRRADGEGAAQVAAAGGARGGSGRPAALPAGGEAARSRTERRRPDAASGAAAGRRDSAAASAASRIAGNETAASRGIPEGAPITAAAAPAVPAPAGGPAPHLVEATLHRLQADLDRRLAGYGIGESVSTSPHSLAARDSRVPRPLADDGRPMAAAPAPAPAAEPVVPAVPRPVEVHIGRLEIVTPGAAGQAGVPVATPAPPAEPLPDFSPWIALRSGTGWRGGR